MGRMHGSVIWSTWDLGDNNEIILELEDNYKGSIRKTSKTYKVSRFPVPKKDENLRAKAILCPLFKGGGDREIDNQLFSNLTYELKQNGRFIMLVSDSEKLNRMSLELRLIRDGWINTDGAARMGDSLEADYSIACSVRPTRQDTEIFGQIIDAQTRAVLAHCDVYTSTITSQDLEDTYRRFVKKLEHQFPIIEVKIMNSDQSAPKALFSRIFPRRNKQTIMVNMGRDTHIVEGMKFIAYHRGPPLRSSVTNEILVPGNVILDGVLTAHQVKTNTAYLSSKNNNKISEATYVVTQ